jgi:hypothetical protein
MPASTPGAPESVDLQVRPVSELDRGQLGQLELAYEQAFPARLRVPLAELTAPGRRDQVLAGLVGDVVAGFAALRLLDTVGWVFLRYYAVAAQWRRQRLGLRLWQLLSSSLTSAGWPARIAFEVEDPADARGDPAEQDVRRGRIAFWESCGAVILPVPQYVMPALTPLGAAEPMILMAAYPAGPDRTGTAGLSELVRAIYGQHYRLAPGHSMITAALDSIAAGAGG